MQCWKEEMCLSLHWLMSSPRHHHMLWDWGRKRRRYLTRLSGMSGKICGSLIVETSCRWMYWKKKILGGWYSMKMKWKNDLFICTIAQLVPSFKLVRKISLISNQKRPSGEESHCDLVTEQRRQWKLSIASNLLSSSRLWSPSPARRAHPKSTLAKSFCQKNIELEKTLLRHKIAEKTKKVVVNSSYKCPLTESNRGSCHIIDESSLWGDKSLFTSDTQYHYAKRAIALICQRFSYLNL